MNDEKKGLLNWIKKYPKKFMLSIFLIVIPIILLITFIGVTIRNSHRFYFDLEGNEPVYLYRSDLTSEKVLSEYITFDIQLEKITLPKQVSTIVDGNETTVLSNGRYDFEISYESKMGPNVSFTFDFLLENTFGSNNHYMTSSNLSSNRVLINYNDSLPFTKYLFWKIERPNLYIRINMSSEEIIPGLKTSDKIFYFKYNLSNEKPTVEQA